MKGLIYNQSKWMLFLMTVLGVCGCSGQQSVESTAQKYLQAIQDRDFELFEECVGREQLSVADDGYVQAWFEFILKDIRFPLDSERFDIESRQFSESEKEHLKSRFAEGYLFVYDEDYEFYQVGIIPSPTNMIQTLYTDGESFYLLLPKAQTAR